MYVPTPEMISSVPMFNTFYRAPASVDILVWNIANKARNNAGLDNSFIWRTIRAIAASPWNRSHIAYSTRGYENYNIEGPQYARRYGPEPLAQPGTGSMHPVMWIPDPDAPMEPGQIFAPMEAPSVTIQAAKVETELPVDVVEELADPARETIILEPTTQEAAEIAAQVPALPSEAEAAAVVAAVTMLETADQVLADPDAPISDKMQAVSTVETIAQDMELAPAEVISDTAANAMQLLATQDQPVISPAPVYPAEVEELPIPPISPDAQPAIAYQEKSSDGSGIATLLASFLAARFFG